MMPDRPSQPSKSFDENIDSLLEELKLAIHWGRPSILLAVHKSIPSQNKAEQALEKKLAAQGQAVVRFEATQEAPDIVHPIVQNGSLEKSVFFVSNIDRGGGESGTAAYEALNIYRELFVENALRVVLWLSVTEALKLPHAAPDFWAFRHRVVEFASPRSPRQSALPAGILIWHIQTPSESPARVKDKIAGRERLLKELPARPESASTRAELLYTLGYLYWTLGDMQKSKRALTEGESVAANTELSKIRAWLQNGLTIIDFEGGEHARALQSFSALAANNVEDAILWVNVSAAMCALGKNNEAIQSGKRAVAGAATSARVWKSLGHIYYWIGRRDEAADCFRQAVEREPGNPFQHVALAACLTAMGLPDETRAQIDLARKYSGDFDYYVSIFATALRGDAEGSITLLKAAVRGGKLSAAEARRDAALQMILEDGFDKI